MAEHFNVSAILSDFFSATGHCQMRQPDQPKDFILGFEVAGLPAPQGSKVRTKFGGMRESNPRTLPWRHAVAQSARKAMLDYRLDPIEKPVHVSLSFRFPRPKGHYGSGRNSGKVRESAPKSMTSKPDLDKLIRAILDGLTGPVLIDDSQVVFIAASKKYVTDGNIGVTVIVLED